MADAGAGEILLTSMDRDGTKRGYDLALLRAVADRVAIPVIASGGGGSAEDLARALDDGPSGGHCQAALAASIFHFGETTVPEVKRRLLELGVAGAPPTTPSRDDPPRRPLMPRRACASLQRRFQQPGSARLFDSFLPSPEPGSEIAERRGEFDTTDGQATTTV